MDFQRIIGSLVIISAIVFGYFHITKKIDARQSGVNVEGTVIEKHLESNYTYIRFKYPVQAKIFSKAFVLPTRTNMKKAGRFA